MSFTCSQFDRYQQSWSQMREASKKRLLLNLHLDAIMISSIVIIITETIFSFKVIVSSFIQVKISCEFILNYNTGYQLTENKSLIIIKQ